MKHFFRSLILLLIAAPAFAGVQSFTVSPGDIREGYVIKQIPLQSYGIPVVKLLAPAYAPVSALPAGVTAGNADALRLMPGMEAKKPFVLVSVPAYSRSADGKYGLLTAFSLEITETAVPVKAA